MELLLPVSLPRLSLSLSVCMSLCVSTCLYVSPFIHMRLPIASSMSDNVLLYGVILLSY
jgi:hypothetical protein